MSMGDSEKRETFSDVYWVRLDGENCITIWFDKNIENPLRKGYLYNNITDVRIDLSSPDRATLGSKLNELHRESLAVRKVTSS